jgi:hypothetical protein
LETQGESSTSDSVDRAFSNKIFLKRAFFGTSLAKESWLNGRCNLVRPAIPGRTSVLEEVDMALFVERPSLSGWLSRVLRSDKAAVAPARSVQFKIDVVDVEADLDESLTGPLSLSEYRDYLDWRENQAKAAVKPRREVG